MTCIKMKNVFQTTFMCIFLLVVYGGNKLCPKPSNSAPTMCTNDCESDDNCTREAICCPGFCFESGIDNIKENNVCTYPDPCANGYCKNDAMCVMTGNLVYKCYCKEGFSGVHCENEINECVSDPCKNGAVCEDLINNYSCCCEPGFTGKNCETEITCESKVSCSKSQCPQFKEAVCKYVPRFFIKDEEGNQYDVTDQC